MFSTQEVLKIAKEAKKATAEKTSRKRRRTQLKAIGIERQEVELVENVSSDSDSDCILVVQRRSH